jgi:CYTH domain-containing protein
VGEGPFEIERRYLARVEDGLWRRLGEGYALRQGYVRTGTPSVRIRLGEPRGPVLTLKSGKGVRRREVETVVPQEVAEELLRAAGKRVIEKVRHPIGRWELDRFEGELQGLTLLEIELDHEDEAIPPPPRGVKILREVTDDKSLTSSALARMSKKEQRRLVQKLYGKDGEGGR